MRLTRLLRERSAPEPVASAAAGPEPARPVALVYRGPAAGAFCAEAVAGVLAASPRGYDVRFVGPGEAAPLSAAELANASVYAQPGGGSLAKAYRRLRANAEDIRSFVASGGTYLGFCLGGYLAGATPGFGLLPGDTDRYIDTAGAEIRGTGDAVAQVLWSGNRRQLYFQDGPHFVLDRQHPGLRVLATYTNGAVAAAVAPYGRGSVGVVGPHPEATPDWFEDVEGLSAAAARRLARDGRPLALDLVEAAAAAARPPADEHKPPTAGRRR